MSQRQKRIAWILGVLSVGLIIALACTPPSERYVGLYYTGLGDTDAAGPSNGALAVGTFVEVRVGTFEGPEDSDLDGYRTGRADPDEGMSILEISSGDPEALEIVETSDQGFTMLAHAPSSGTELDLTVERTDPNGDVVTDEVTATIPTAEVASVTVQSPCEEGIYYNDGIAEFEYRMYDDSGNELTGIGHYPLSLEPEAAGEILHSHHRLQRLVVDTGTQTGQFEVVSDTGDTATSFELIEPRVDHFELTEHYDAPEVWVNNHLRAAASFRLDVDVGDSRQTVCGPASTVVDVASATPDICSASVTEFGPTHDIGIEAHSAGTCEVRAEVPGTELADSFTVEVRD